MGGDSREFFRVDHESVLGRYARANRFIQAGEIFIDEVPFVVGPKPCSPPICLGCYVPVDGGNDGPRCLRCRWPLCDRCQLIVDDTHHAVECEIFVENKVKFQSFPSTDACMQLDCITPLRMLLHKETDPDRWANGIMQMEYHPEERYDTPTYRADEVNVVGYLRGPCKLRDRFTGEMIQRICGILEVNSFEARTVNNQRVRCIYPKASVIAHSCRPNTTHSIMPSDSFRIRFRASIDIEEDGIFYTTYSYTMASTQTRQQYIQLSKFFRCKCERCCDPTELSTNFSSFICQMCSRGLITPAEPTDKSSQWHCSDCAFTTTDKFIKRSLSKIDEEIEATEKVVGINETIDGYENLLSKYGRILHPNHYLQVKIKELLIALYAARLGSGKDFQSDVVKCLERRLDLCQNILDLLNIFQPGLNRPRAMILYEIYSSTIALIKLNWNSLSNRDQRIAESNTLLDECLPILRWEDDTSVEHTVADICSRLAESVLMMSLGEIPMH